MTPPSPIRVASTIMLVRQVPNLQVLMVKRNREIDSFSGAMVFPGGKVEPRDLDQVWEQWVIGWNDVPDDERGPRVAAVRETFEECGVLVATDRPVIAGIDVTATRAEMEGGRLSFLDFVRTHDIKIDLTQLTRFARWLTPPIVPKRFDTFFYLIEMPGGQDAAHDGREAVENEWIEPEAALKLAECGHRTIVFPTRMNLRLLSRSGSIREAIEMAMVRKLRQVSPSIELRDGQRFLRLSPEDGYGDVNEPLSLG
jgi:8-oxo-dGTP pyrophosphatase MutT (NUDIX family)